MSAPHGAALELALQTTLLGLAIAIILALLAALVGPLLIDWSGHRSLFEAEASRLIGVHVRVSGEIDARLLPSPQLTLHGIEIGRSGEENVRAKSLAIEFALGPLMRGEWRATELHLAGPQLSLALDATGRLQAPTIAVGFNPDALTIERLSIEDGKVTLADAASGASVTLDKLWFNGDARSLLGPVKGEGAVTIAGELYPFRLSSGRYSDDDGLRLRINVDPIARPLSIEADGLVSIAGGAPKFDGAFTLTRPVGIASRGASVTQPWRINSKIKVNASAALMQQLEFQYGSEEQGLKLTGVADFKFGAQPRFDGVLSGRQIDLDRALAASDGTRPLPAAAIRELAELGGGAFRPGIPIQIGVGIDQITLGGSAVQNVRGDISTGAQGWNLDRFEFRAPGFTQARLSGHLAVGSDGVVFTGPAEIDSSDPRTLAAWLEGREEAPQSDPRSLSVRGDVTLSGERFAVERLNAAFDRKPVAGRFAYIFAVGDKSAKLDAVLNAAELDLDAALGFGKALLAGSKIARPHDMTIAADIGRATIGGVAARKASVMVKVDARGLLIDRLSVADLGGGSFSASGRIDTGGQAPRGSLAFDFESGQTAAIASLVEKFAPLTAKPAGDLLGRARRAKLHATLDLTEERQPPNQLLTTVAQFNVTGVIDAMNVDVKSRVSGDWQKPAAADVRVDGTVDAPEGAALLRLLGLDRFMTTGKGAGQLKLLVLGAADGDQKIDLKFAGESLYFQSLGKGRISLDKGITLDSTVEIAKADLRPLWPAGMAGSGEPLPFSMNSHVILSGRDVTLDDFNARLGQSSLRGTLAFTGDSPRRVSGTLDADTIDAAALIAAAAGIPSPPVKNATAIWSSEPFSSGQFGDYAGEVALKARRFDVLPRLTAREFRTTLRLGKQEFALDDMTGDVAGGKLTGRIAFNAADGGLKTQGKISIAGADAAALLPGGARPPVSGTAGFSAEWEGRGLSPIALIGSLQGTGKITLAGGQFAGMDPRAFDAVTRAVDQGLPIDGVRIADVVGKALDSGQLAVKRADGTIVISAGQMRLNNISAESQDATLALSGNLDLTDGAIEARLVLSGLSQAAGARPDIFMALRGPFAAPSRSIDVAALTGWLTLRAVDNQSKRLRAIEGASPQPASPAPKSEAAPALPAPVNVRPLPAPARNQQPLVGPQN